MVCSAAWTLLNRGSKYWQENWETKVELNEKKVTGPLFGPRGAQIRSSCKSPDPEPRPSSCTPRVVGVVYAAVSPAAQAVSGNRSEPGWDFWGAPSGDGSFVSLFELRERLRADQKESTSRHRR